MKFTSTTKSLLLTLLCSLSQIAFCDLAKMEVVVVDDETGLPMTNATVKGVFPINNGWLGLKGPTPPNTDIQKTDANGRWYKAVIATPSFLYYLNPNPLDRNLEWDGVTNLFPGPRVHARR